jgi:hypothetical protein
MSSLSLSLDSLPAAPTVIVLDPAG